MQQKSLISYLMVIVIILTMITGCIEDNSNNQQNNQTELTLGSLIITTKDLPEGYVTVSIDRNQSNQLGFIQEIPAEEILGITFAHDSGENVTEWPFIASTVARFISYKQAKDSLSYSEYNMRLTLAGLFNDTGKEFNETLGDFSMGRYFHGPLNETYNFTNASWTYIFARVNKTVFFVSLHKVDPSETYPFEQQTIDLMDAMVKRIKPSSKDKPSDITPSK